MILFIKLYLMCEISVSTKIVKFNRYKHKINDWMTKDILNSIKYRDNLYKKFLLSKSNSIEKENYKFNLRLYNSLLKKEIRKAKTHFYFTEFDKHKNNIKKTWDTIKIILNKTSSTSAFPKKCIVTK